MRVYCPHKSRRRHGHLVDKLASAHETSAKQDGINGTLCA